MLTANGTQAQAVAQRTNDAGAVSSYWTPSRLINAKALDLPGVANPGRETGALAAPETSSASGAPGRPAGDANSTVRLHAPVDLGSADDGVGPAAANPSGQKFTNSRVVPMSVLRNTYPWSTVGKLFFRTDTGGDSVCSAAVVQRRVIMTAGHCVFNGQTRRFYANFLFVPGFDNGASPCGGYASALTLTTASWANGGGRFPNAADFAAMVAVNKPCKGQSRIGLSTGWLGWRTGALLGNHVTILGYPCNLDRCNVLQRADTQVTRAASPNSAEAGTYHEGGASGGPWVEDFGVNAAGQSRPNTLNVVGVTSYQPGNRSLDYLGSSVVNSEWTTLFNRACREAGACN